jgi:hypothetical protein
MPDRLRRLLDDQLSDWYSVIITIAGGLVVVAIMLLSGVAVGLVVAACLLLKYAFRFLGWLLGRSRAWWRWRLRAPERAALRQIEDQYTSSLRLMHAMEDRLGK